VVREGGEVLSLPSEDEIDMLDRAGVARDGARLACQAAGAGEVVVGIRLAVKPAGCSGLRYSIDPVDAVRPDDAVFECGRLQVAIDPASLPFVRGTTIRLAQEGLARRLRFDNPNARQSCGCGESFDT